MAVWLVRAGSKGQREDLALEQGVVVIGWDDLPDLSAVGSRGDVEALLKERFQGGSPNQLRNWAGQVWSFKARIKVEDLVALPLKAQSAIAIGRVTGSYAYRGDLPDGAHHTRPVEWLRDDLPRSSFDQDLLYSLGAFMTVCQIQRNNAEERIRAMVSEAPAPLETKPSEEPVEGEGVDLAVFADDQIRAFVTEKFRGHDLTRLVAAVLTAQGYKTETSKPGPDGGVDIIAGRGPMGFDPPRLVVQVKSGNSPVDVKVLRELQGVMGNFGADTGLLVSWGGFKRTVIDEARVKFFGLRLWDAGSLVEELTSVYDRLPDDIQAELPLRRIWTLVREG